MLRADPSRVHVQELEGTQIIPTKSTTAHLDSGGVLTVLCQVYSDRIVVSVSQREKLGYVVCINTLTIKVQAQVQSSLQSNEDAELSIPPLPNVLLVPLFGAPPYQMQDLYAFYATQIAVHVSQTSHLSNGKIPSMAGQAPKPLVIALALDPLSTDEEELDMVQERRRLNKIVTMIHSCKIW